MDPSDNMHHYLAFCSNNYKKKFTIPYNVTHAVSWKKNWHKFFTRSNTFTKKQIIVWIRWRQIMIILSLISIFLMILRYPLCSFYLVTLLVLGDCRSIIPFCLMSLLLLFFKCKKEETNKHIFSFFVTI